MIGKPKKDESKEIKKPAVDSFKIGGKLKGSFKEIAKKLSSVSFLEVAMESNAVNIAYVESRDISNKPYLFSMMKMREDEIGVVYSTPQNMAPKKRRIDVIRQLLNILGIISNEYEVDEKTIYNLIEKAMKDIGELVDKKTAEIYVEYDTLKNENTILDKKIRVLEKEIEELKNSNYELREKNNELTIKMNRYEKPSDETIKIKLIEWIKDHNGKISIPDFVAVHLGGNPVGETRVEKILNELVTQGYLSSR
ncbi:MAG: hypothetical protein PHU63_02490 [Candidatus ainarchaeum sp.]|nr:hypothetical protein [Candidatus ainarchaeum sp.]